MTEWFLVVEPRGVDGLTEVVEFDSYRDAMRAADCVVEDGDRSVEVVDFEGRIVRSVGLDEFDGCPGFVSVPLRAGVYRWQQASECFREVPR